MLEKPKEEPKHPKEIELGSDGEEESVCSYTPWKRFPEHTKDYYPTALHNFNVKFA